MLTRILTVSSGFTTKTIAQSGDGSTPTVTWINLINCVANGSSLQKISGRDDTSDAGARSEQQITSGDAFLEFTAAQSDKTVFCGFSRNPIGIDYADIDFGFKLTNTGVAEVRENNIYQTETSYRAGDVFRVSIDGGIVRYFKNNAFLYTSFRSPSYPLMVHATLVHLGARIDNVSMGALSANSLAEWRMYQHDSAHTANATASKIDANNVSTLVESRRFQAGGLVTGTPVVARGMVYVGSWDGDMYALRESDGSLVWSFTADTTSDNCGSNYGIDSTAALVGGRLYFGSAACTMYALDPATGQEIWRNRLADPAQGFHLWSSPLVFDGKIYVSLASNIAKRFAASSCPRVSVSLLISRFPLRATAHQLSIRQPSSSPHQP
ncbi:MAG TPA: PQQ-binding-like beta-propeller repeat protein [Blastocatellia bacterium]|nr:PQQ-binding-like beta-propeller repeat protein [Blastocatellia bacterium]